MATLRRIRDGRGDSGSRVEAIQWKKNGQFDKVVGQRPVVGCSMLVGSVTARSYSSKDYWLTTPVTKIIEEKEDYVRFKTENSEYEIIY